LASSLHAEGRRTLRGSAIDGKFVAAIQACLDTRTDALHAEHIAELEQKVAGLKKALHLVIIEDIVKRSAKLIEFLQPLNHEPCSSVANRSATATPSVR
jgi:hypothetical protein